MIFGIGLLKLKTTNETDIDQTGASSDAYIPNMNF